MSRFAHSIFSHCGTTHLWITTQGMLVTAQRRVVKKINTTQVVASTSPHPRYNSTNMPSGSELTQSPSSLKRSEPELSSEAVEQQQQPTKRLRAEDEAKKENKENKATKLAPA